MILSENQGIQIPANLRSSVSKLLNWINDKDNPALELKTQVMNFRVMTR